MIENKLAEAVRQVAYFAVAHPNARIAIVAAGFDLIRKRVLPEFDRLDVSLRPSQMHSRRMLVVWANKAEALCYSAESPETLRGHEPYDLMWIYEDGLSAETKARARLLTRSGELITTPSTESSELLSERHRATARNTLLARLRTLQQNLGDPEQLHIDADRALLAFIGDPEVTAAYDRIQRWHA